jgi:lipopolysaccharide transport system ATP-binding protein
METVLKIEEVSKMYQLGVVSTGTLRNDFLYWLARKRGREDEFLKVGEDKGNELIWALRDVSFEVKRGEVLGIVGKNGAGKSTLLKILSRVTEPTKGKVKIKGRIASLLEVGTGFHPELTGRENIYLNGAILGMRRNEIKNKFDEIVEFSGVSKYIDTPVKRYSSGMYVRLAFAVAAHLEPDILIIDEVLAVGDADFQAKCLGKMKDVSGHGRTVLFVSHSMPAVKNLCSRAILMEHGKVALEGEVTGIIERYLNSGSQLSEKGVIPPSASSWTTGKARFTMINMFSPNGERLESLFYEQPFEVEFLLEVKERIQDAIVDVSIGDFEGRATNCSTFDIDKKLMTLEPGTYTFRIKPDVKLLPGSYSFYLGVHSMTGTGLSHDLVERVRPFFVLPFTKDDSAKFPMNISLGKVRVNADWDIAFTN